MGMTRQRKLLTARNLRRELIRHLLGLEESGRPAADMSVQLPFETAPDADGCNWDIDIDGFAKYGAAGLMVLRRLKSAYNLRSF